MARKVTPYTVIRWAIEFCAYTDEGLSEHQAKKIIAETDGVSLSTVHKTLKNLVECTNIGLDTLRALGLSNMR